MSTLLLSPVETACVTVLFGAAWVPAAGSVLRDLALVAAVDARAPHREAGGLQLALRVVGVLADDVRHGDGGLLLPDDDGHGGARGARSRPRRASRR